MYKFSDNFQYSKLYENIETMYSRWAQVQEDTAKISAGNALFHTFPTEHVNSLKNLEANKIFHQTNFERAVVNLDKKRERAFRSRDFTRWELKAEDVKRAKELLDNKEEAYKGTVL